MTLGILDWGIGGCGFYDLLRQKSAVPIVYLSDSGFTPYGKVKKDELQDRVNTCISFLQEQGASHIVVACNSAGSVVEDDDTTISAITFAHQLLMSANEYPVGIIGGKRTIESGIFPEDDQHILGIAQKLSAHIEAGNLDGEALESDVKSILNPMSKVHSLIMACTHYPAISEILKKHLPDDCTLLDPAKAMLEHIETHWPIDQYDVQANQWFTTGDTNQTQLSARLAFNVHISRINKIKI